MTIRPAGIGLALCNAKIGVFVLFVKRAWKMIF